MCFWPFRGCRIRQHTARDGRSIGIGKPVRFTIYIKVKEDSCPSPKDEANSTEIYASL